MAAFGFDRRMRHVYTQSCVVTANGTRASLFITEQTESWRQNMRYRFAAILLLLTTALASPLLAQSIGIEGYWRGIGFVKPTDGQREKIHCRVTFNRKSTNTYGVQAKCASQGTNITQTGTLQRTGRNRYSGTFYNSDYNVSGRIQTRQRGNRQNVTFRSETGFGQITLFRR